MRLFVILYNMASNEEKELKENIEEFKSSAIIAKEKGDYNVSATLFFKALAVLSDLYIFKKQGKIPSSHSERFKILETEYPEIYLILDKDFPFYQQSYRMKLTKEISEVLKEDVNKLIELLKE